MIMGINSITTHWMVVRNQMGIGITSMHHTLVKNGVFQRRNITLYDDSQSMLIFVDLQQYFGLIDI